MSSLIYRVVGWWKRREPRPAMPLAPAPTAAPTWTVQDMGQLKLFLGSETGRTLAARVQAVGYRNALEGCNDAFHTAHSAGKAAGFDECWRYIESLSRSASDTAENHDAPTPEGEPSLRDLYSP